MLMDRIEFVQKKFIPKISPTCPSVCLENVYFLARNNFLEAESFVPFNICVQRKILVKGSDIDKGSQILFICHQWYQNSPQQIDNNSPEGKTDENSDPTNINGFLGLLQSLLVKADKQMGVGQDTTSETPNLVDCSKSNGQGVNEEDFADPDDDFDNCFEISRFFLNEHREIQYIWVDYSCLSTGLEKKERKHRIDNGIGYKAEMENIQTAMLMCSHCLLIPKIAKIGNETFTDLKEFSTRGWIKIECALALLGNTAIYLTFSYTVNDEKKKGSQCIEFCSTKPKSNSKEAKGSNTKHSPNSTQHGEGLSEDHLKQALKEAETSSIVCGTVNRFIKSLHHKKTRLNEDIFRNWREAEDPQNNIVRLAVSCYGLHPLEALFGIYPENAQYDNLKKQLNPAGEVKKLIVTEKKPNLVSDVQDIPLMCRLLLSAVAFASEVIKISDIEELPEGELSEIIQGGSSPIINTYAYREKGYFPQRVAQIIQRLERSTEPWNADFSYNTVGVPGCTELSNLLQHPHDTLQKLLLDRTYLQDDSLKLLCEGLSSQFCALKLLSLENNNLCQKEAVILAPALQKNTSLESLRLGHNRLKDDGIDALAPALFKNKTLTKLRLTDNALGKTAAFVLGCIVEECNLVFLDLSNNLLNVGASNYRKKVITEKEYGKEKDPARNEDAEDGDVLFGLLNTFRSSQAPAAAKVIEENSAGKKQASNHRTSKLKTTSLIILALGQKKEEEKLKVVIGDPDEGIAALLFGMILRNEKHTNNPSNVGPSPLKTLDVTGNGVNFEGASAIANFLKTNATLEHLIIDKNYIGAEGAEYVAAALKKNKSLKTLSLDSNFILADGVHAIAEPLKFTNASLTELSLSFNNLDYPGTSELADVILTNISLKKLKLGCCNMTRAGPGALIREFSSNRNLVELHLNGNKILEKDMDSLSIALETHPTLRILNMWACDIRDNQAAKLAHSLQQNIALRVLILFSNCIGDDGAAAFAKLIQKNTKLFELNLNNNIFGFKSVKQLADALKANSHLCFLRISGNKSQTTVEDEVTDEDYDAIYEAVNRKLFENSRGDAHLGTTEQHFDHFDHGTLMEIKRKFSLSDSILSNYSERGDSPAIEGDGTSPIIGGVKGYGGGCQCLVQ
mmetsp:Transcript_2994/g.4277  ORF Transcript_2994/g.4277 Transcript_2994/m.4277 type:complete len:1133 (+) Transcript_2994:33-3431(+)